MSDMLQILKFCNKDIVLQFFPGVEEILANLVLEMKLIEII